jgi:hypothetical protein
MRKAALMALIIGATAILAACSPGATPGLTDREWQLTAITEKVPAFQDRPDVERQRRLQQDRRHVQDARE